MIAKYEQSSLSGDSRATLKYYRDLQNLPHWHMESELIFAEKGSAEVMAENAVFTIPENGCAFIRSGAVHYIKAAADSIIAVMKIDSELIYSAVGPQTPVRPLLENEHPEVKEILGRIRQEMSEGKKFSDVICASLAVILTAEIFRGETLAALPSASESTAYKELLRLISERFADITFEEAAEFMCFSKPYFSKYFRRMSGMTFSEYVNVVRIGEAVKLLSRTGISVGEAAFAAGFGTIRSFNRTFKRLTGFTPRNMPENYIFTAGSPENTADGFDPTLPGSKVLE